MEDTKITEINTNGTETNNNEIINTSNKTTLDKLNNNLKEMSLQTSIPTNAINDVDNSIISERNKSDVDLQKVRSSGSTHSRRYPDEIIYTDQYGFIKDPDDKQDEDNCSPLQYNARLEKWNYMLNNYDEFCKKHFAKLKKRVRKGIPDCLRGYAWQKLINVDEFYQKNLFKSLDMESVNTELKTIIKNDIHRTFPKNTHFRTGEGQRQLLEVLSKYSTYNKKIGYVQGMGYITALLLTYMDEERAFFMLHAIMKKRELENVYSPGFPDLHKKFYVLLNLEKKLVPKVYATFLKNEFYPYSYASSWFLCLFSRNLKFNALVRIIDSFILEGYKVIYRFTLAFLKSREQEISECVAMDEIFDIMKKFFENVNINEISKIAFGFHLSKKDIEFYEREYDKVKDDNTNEFMKQL